MRDMAARTLILRTAGTNNDLETEFALRLAGAETKRLHINRLRENPALLSEFDIMVLPGGFSYGDYLGAGAVLANELVTFLKTPLTEFVKEGKFVVGICNGFQVLVKAGLLPGPLFGEREVTLAANDSHKFEDRWVYLESAQNKSGTAQEGERMYMPVAHAEGKIVCRSEDTLKRLSDNGQVLFRYSGPDGSKPCYPWNPNGSADNIAGLCDPGGRVIGMMPHPERCCMPQQNPAWTRKRNEAGTDGLTFFRRIVSKALQDAI